MMGAIRDNQVLTVAIGCDTPYPFEPSMARSFGATDVAPLLPSPLATQATVAC